MTQLSRRPLTLLLVAGASAFGAFALMALALRAGPVTAILLVAAAAAGLLLLTDARAATLAAVGVIVLAESNPDWGISATAKLYAKTAVFFTPVEFMALLALAAVVVDAQRTGRPLRMPRVFAVPLLLTVAALVFGLVNARMSGGVAGYATRSVLQAILPLFVLPLLIVNVVRTPQDLRRALGAGGVLAAAKALLGLGVLFAGVSQTLSDGGPHMTYYEATANVVLMIAVLFVAAARVARVRLPAWVTFAAPLVFACLLLSYRRMFWVATIASLLIIAVVASGRVGRRLAVPGALLLAGAVWVISLAPVVADLSGPIVQRGASITPGKISHNTQDRYRIAERKNVIADLKTHPLAGAGIAVGWQATYPLPFEYATGRDYVHFGLLWWWLNMGILGAITYVWLMLSATIIGWRVWRLHADGVARVAGLALGLGALGLAVVELTAANVGPDQRTTALFGIVLGLLASAHAQLSPAIGGKDAGSIE